MRTLRHQQQTDLSESEATYGNDSGGIYQIHPDEEGSNAVTTEEVHRCRSDVYGRLFQSLLFLQMFSGGVWEDAEAVYAALIHSIFYQMAYFYNHCF